MTGETTYLRKNTFDILCDLHREQAQNEGVPKTTAAIAGDLRKSNSHIGKGLNHLLDEGCVQRSGGLQKGWSWAITPKGLKSLMADDFHPTLQEERENRMARHLAETLIKSFGLKKGGTDTTAYCIKGEDGLVDEVTVVVTISPSLGTSLRALTDAYCTPEHN